MSWIHALLHSASSLTSGKLHGLAVLRLVFFRFFWLFLSIFDSFSVKVL